MTAVQERPAFAAFLVFQKAIGRFPETLPGDRLERHAGRVKSCR